MPECPICRRSYDARFQVFVPPHREAFDTVACARRGAEVWGWDKASPAAIVLPPVEAAAAAPQPPFAARHKKKMAVIAALAVAPGQAALATGVGLLAAGSAASIYLWAKPAGKATPVAVSAPHARPTLTPRPTATGPSKPFPVKHPAKQVRKVAVTKRAHRVPTPAATVRVTPSASSPSTQLISRAVPVPVPTAKPKPKPTTSKVPPATPTAPAPPPAKAPPPTKAPTPKPPTGGGGGITSAAVPAPQRPPTSSSKSKKPKPTNPPPAAPPPPQPPPTTTTNEDCTPGNGWGDKNHVHCGPPGQSDDSESSGGDDSGNQGQGDDHGNGHGHDGDHGNGGGNGHGHGH